MGEYGSDGPSPSFCAGQLRAPRARVKMREQELVHGVVDTVGFEQDVANLA
jgi:hypothetical protein